MGAQPALQLCSLQLRVAVTGQGVSPGIFEVLVAMGRELVLARLDQAVEWLKTGAVKAV